MKNSMHNHLVGMALALLLAMVTGQANAVVWIESPDAGDLPGTAQTTMGTGSLDAITGRIENTPDDIDMFAIKIPDLSLFSATTVSPGTALVDPSLFLFDSGDMGVAANGDEGPTTQSTIPAGSLTGGGGIYYLALSLWDDKPISPSGEIFPDLFTFSSNGEVVGPTGPGGGKAISDWYEDHFSEHDEAYEILLTGVEPAIIPEPTALAIWALGLLAVGLYGWRRW